MTDPIGRMISALVAVIIVAFVVAAVGWKCSADSARRARAETKVAEAQNVTQRAASEMTAKQLERERDGATLTATNRTEILGADNANEDAGATARALRTALCRRVSHHDDPRCAELRGPDRAVAPV